MGPPHAFLPRSYRRLKGQGDRITNDPELSLVAAPTLPVGDAARAVKHDIIEIYVGQGPPEGARPTLHEAHAGKRTQAGITRALPVS